MMALEYGRRDTDLFQGSAASSDQLRPPVRIGPDIHKMERTAWKMLLLWHVPGFQLQR